MCDEQHRHGTHARHIAYMRRLGLQNTHTEAVVFRACASRTAYSLCSDVGINRSGFRLEQATAS